MNRVILIIGVFIFFYTHHISAQEIADSAKLYTFQTNGGNYFTGSVAFEDESRLEIQTSDLGLVTIAKKDIKEITHVTAGQIFSGKIWVQNKHYTRYFWSPSAYGLKRGEGYYQNLWVLFNQVSIGITDNFSMGLGMIPTFLIGSIGLDILPIWITPKFSIPVQNEKLNIGAGVLAGRVGLIDNSNFGIVYGVCTIGNTDKNVTFGLGYGYAGGEMGNIPVINIAATTRVSRRGYLLTENYLFPGIDYNMLFSFGGRTITQVVAIDYGCFFTFVNGGFIGIPWLGLSASIKLGKKK